MAVKPFSAPDPASSRGARTAREARADATRQAILDAALEVFCEQTYGGARIEQIAERAGVAMGTIYKHFPGKQALANAVFRFWKEKTREFSYPHPPGGSIRDRYRLWYQQVARFATEHPLAYEFLVTHHHGPYLDEESRAAGDPMDQLAVRTLREGQAEGVVRAGDPELLASIGVGVLYGLLRELKAKGRPFDAEALALGEECGWALLVNPDRPDQLNQMPPGERR